MAEREGVFTRILMAAEKKNLIFGIHPVLEALDSGKELDKVLVRRGDGSGQIKQLLGQLRIREIPVQRVPVEKLNSITGRNHQGVVAYLSSISYCSIATLLPSVYEAGEDPLVVLLDGVSDVRNFGAIARTAECAGAHAVVIPASGSARINADAIKASAGALHRIPVCRHRNLEEIAIFLKDSGLQLFAATEHAKRTCFEVDMKGPAVIILGSEERGISPQLLRMAGLHVSIPLKGSISSLNVSVAAGILLFEVVRQRGLQA